MFFGRIQSVVVIFMKRLASKDSFCKEYFVIILAALVKSFLDDGPSSHSWIPVTKDFWVLLRVASSHRVQQTG